MKKIRRFHHACHFDQNIMRRRKRFIVNIVHFLFIIGILEMVKQQKRQWV